MDKTAIKSLTDNDLDAEICKAFGNQVVQESGYWYYFSDAISTRPVPPYSSDLIEALDLVEWYWLDVAIEYTRLHDWSIAVNGEYLATARSPKQLARPIAEYMLLQMQKSMS